MFLIIFIGLIILLLHFTCLNTLIKLIILKLKLGSKAIIRFYPLTGDFAQIPKSNQLYGDGLKHFQNGINQQTSFVLSNLMHQPLIEIYDPEYYKEVFLHHENYSRIDTLYHDKLTSRGILYSYGQRWKTQRNILGVPFTYEKLKERIPIVQEVVKNKLNNWDSQKLHSFLLDLTTEIVMKSFFGQKAMEFRFQNGKSVSEEILDLDEVMASQNLFNPYVVLKRLIFGRKGDLILPNKAQKQLNQRVDQVISFINSLIENKKQSNNQNNQQQDFLDIYIEAQKKNPEIENLEICSMFVTMFAAGSGTSVHSLAMTLYFLGQEQEAQDEIRQELNSLTNLNDVTKMIKLSAFITEMFRFKAPFFSPFIRKAKVNHNIKDLTIQKGMNILILFAAPGWSSKYYNNPHMFDYKRWLDNNQNAIKEDNGFVYVPFSAGPRNCIGQHMAQMNMKLILSQIIRKYRIKLNPNIKVQFPINLAIRVEPEEIIQFEQIQQQQQQQQQ